MTDTLHSSGTTSFPKPITFSNNYIFHAINAFEILINSNDNLDNLTQEDALLPIAPLWESLYNGPVQASC